MKKKFSQKKLLVIYDALYKAYGARNWWPADSPFEVVIGAILTQNTSWTNVTKAIDSLKAGNVLNPESLHKMPVESLAKLIISSGYYNQKAKKIKRIVEYFKKYDFQFENMQNLSTERLREELLEINGVGPETADSILLYVLNRPVFVIDAYTKRLFSRLGFVDENIEYHDLQRLIAQNLPLDAPLFNEFHALIVYFSHHQCKKRPLCDTCFLKKECNYWKGSNLLKSS